ncbi:MAG: fibrinogen-like YCDxxxxGGGW domain-containing protein [Nannocystaceae bacterium]
MLKRKAVPVATSLLSLCLACGGGGEETTATTDSTGTSAGPTTSPTTSDPTTASTTDSGSDATTSTTDPMTTMGSTDSDSETTDPTTTTDTDTDTSEPEPFCGDGNIDADDGEECDNGPENADDGACTSQCLNAVCGDGFVGPGEACDDGNTEDGDECTNACALASCGDMVVQAPEECDDGNDIDSDACLSSCLIAVCGDNVVYEGQEECDDANGNNADACTTACMFPTCDDNLQSGAETDLDCGGGDCPPCELGLMCMAPMDCSSGNCDANICAIAASCGQIAMGDPNAPSGVYQLDVDGEGGADPFMAYCDMDIDEGGWTLVLNLDTSDNHVMWWADPLWTDANTHGTAQNALTADYKGEAWNQLAGATEILLVVHEEGALLGWKTFAKVDGATMYDHFQGRQRADRHGGQRPRRRQPRPLGQRDAGPQLVDAVRQPLHPERRPVHLGQRRLPRRQPHQLAAVDPGQQPWRRPRRRLGQHELLLRRQRLRQRQGLQRSGVPHRVRGPVGLGAVLRRHRPLRHRQQGAVD